MKVKDIITLVKAGYTPQEIGALENSADVIELINGGVSKEDVPTLLEISKTVEDIQKEEKEEEENTDNSGTDDIDYKAEYEKLLKEKQKKKADEEVEAHEKTADEILADVARDFM